MGRWNNSRAAQNLYCLPLPSYREVLAVTVFLLASLLLGPLLARIANPASEAAQVASTTKPYDVNVALDSSGLLELINSERSKHQTGSLVSSDALSQAASQAATAAASSQLFSPSQSWLESHLQNSGYQAERWQGQLVVGHSSNASVLEWLRQQPVGATFESQYSEIGVAIVPTMVLGKDSKAVVLFVASPKAIGRADDNQDLTVATRPDNVSRPPAAETVQPQPAPASPTAQLPSQCSPISGLLSPQCNGLLGPVAEPAKNLLP